MDSCCLNRPTDNQAQDKIRIESGAIKLILSKCDCGIWKLIGSEVLEFEIMKTPDLSKRNCALHLYAVAKESIPLNNEIQNRAIEIQEYGLDILDSLHFASAEYRKVNVLLTVDKDFIKFSKQINSRIIVINPINWFMEKMQNE
jgi:hypothetical protein